MTASVTSFSGETQLWTNKRCLPRPAAAAMLSAWDADLDVVWEMDVGLDHGTQCRA